MHFKGISTHIMSFNETLLHVLKCEQLCQMICMFFLIDISHYSSFPSFQEFHLREEHGDLFSCPENEALAHCVSQDFAMGKGIAVQFKKKFGGVAELKRQGKFFSLVNNSMLSVNWITTVPTTWQ